MKFDDGYGRVQERASGARLMNDENLRFEVVGRLA